MAGERASSPAHQRITLSGFPFDIPGTWSRKTGGRTAAEIRKHHEGGELFQEEMSGSSSTTENITISRQFKPARDLDLLRNCHRYSGRAFGAVAIQHLDEDGNPYGRPIVREAGLLAVNDPDHDSDDQSSDAMIELEIAVAGEIG